MSLNDPILSFAPASGMSHLYLERSGCRQVQNGIHTEQFVFKSPHHHR